MGMLRSLVLGTALAVALPLMGGTAHAETFKLTAGSSHPPIVPWARALKDLVVPETTKRAEALGHKIEWVEAYSGVLYNFDNTLEGVEEGLADVGWVGTLWEPQKMPLHNVTYFAPFGATNMKNLTEIAWELHEKVPAMMEAWDKHNQVLLAPFAADNYVVLSRKPIRTFADLNGIKFNAGGAIAGYLAGTGAIAVNAGLPTHYTNIQTGVVDGSITPLTGVLPFKLHEVAPYVTFVNLGGSIPGALTMNKDTWNKLPPEMQAMFKDVGKLYAEWVREQVDAFYDKTVDILKKNPNVTVIEMPLEEQKKWAAALPDIAGTWVKDAEARGLPAKEVLKVYMEGTRARGETPLRDWDKQ